VAIFDIDMQNPAEIGPRRTSQRENKQIECGHFGIGVQVGLSWSKLDNCRECYILWAKELLSRVAEGQARWSPATYFDSFGYTPRSLGKGAKSCSRACL